MLHAVLSCQNSPNEHDVAEIDSCSLTIPLLRSSRQPWVDVSVTNVEVRPRGVLGCVDGFRATVLLAQIRHVDAEFACLSCLAVVAGFDVEA
jgi:hypothetical protein